MFSFKERLGCIRQACFPLKGCLLCGLIVTFPMNPENHPLRSVFSPALEFQHGKVELELSWLSLTSPRIFTSKWPTVDLGGLHSHHVRLNPQEPLPLSGNPNFS